MSDSTNVRRSTAPLPGGAPKPKRNWGPLMIGGTLVVVVAGLALAAVSLGSGGGTDETPPTVSDIITTSTTAAPEAPPDVTVDVTPTTGGPLPTEVVTVVEPGQAGQYTVRPGDTLSSLARGFGVPLRALAEANGIPNWDLIHPGEVLVIPEVPD